MVDRWMDNDGQRMGICELKIQPQIQRSCENTDDGGQMEGSYLHILCAYLLAKQISQVKATSICLILYLKCGKSWPHSRFIEHADRTTN